MSDAKKAVEVLKSDGVIIFPTETTYGVGCRVGSEKAITRLYEIKKRDSKKPTSIVVRDLSQAREFGVFDQDAEKLARHFWPGPLTLVVAATTKVSKLISNQGTIGIRQPSHATLLDILTELGEPILAPSANFAGEPTPTNLASVDSRLKAMVDYVVDESAGGEKPSTVIDLTKKRPSLLREGPIDMKQIEEVLGGSFG